MNNLFEFNIKTKKEQEFVDITNIINEAISEEEIESGFALVYCPHTTAGITINENGDPDVVRDMIMQLNKLIPVEGDYKHLEGNSHAHLKSSYVGIDKNIIIYDGKLLLGKWQSIYFCEFDGPRNRKFFVKIIED